MKYMSTVLLNDLYDQTEKNIHKAIAEWQQIHEQQMLAKPDPDKWSASQCLEHLNSYGRYYLPAMQAAIEKARDTKPAVYFKSSWLGNYFYKSMLTDSIGMPKTKMKSPRSNRPSEQPDPAKALDDFIGQLEMLGKLLNQAHEININKARVPVSIAPFIRLKLGDILLFFTAHISRHMLQAEKAIKWVKPQMSTIVLSAKENV